VVFGRVDDHTVEVEQTGFNVYHLCLELVNGIKWLDHNFRKQCARNFQNQGVPARLFSEKKHGR